MPMARILNMFFPTYKFTLPVNEHIRDHNEHFYADQISKSDKICAHNVMINESCLKRLHEVHVPKFTSPLLTIECGFDKAVSNKAIEKFHSECLSEDKTIIKYDEVSHEI